MHHVGIDDCGLPPILGSLSLFLVNDTPTGYIDDNAIIGGSSCSVLTKVPTADCGGDKLCNGKCVMLDAGTAP